MEVLLQPYFFYSRDDQCARSPVFARVSPNTWKIRWRYDFATLVAPEAWDAVNLFYYKYVFNSKYLKRLALQPGDILVTDNWRVLHGREAFTDDPEKPRLLRRLWVGDDRKIFVNPLGITQYQKVYEQYQPYSFLDVERRQSPISVSTGIRLKPESQAVAEKLLSKLSFHK